MYGIHPGYDMLYSFGYIYFIHLPSQKCHKLATQSIRCALMDYSTAQKGFVSVMVLLIIFVSLATWF